jgi:hypothetical protein
VLPVNVRVGLDIDHPVPTELKRFLQRAA